MKMQKEMFGSIPFYYNANSYWKLKEARLVKGWGEKKRKFKHIPACSVNFRGIGYEVTYLNSKKSRHVRVIVQKGREIYWDGGAE